MRETRASHLREEDYLGVERNFFLESGRDGGWGCEGKRKPLKLTHATQRTFNPWKVADYYFLGEGKSSSNVIFDKLEDKRFMKSLFICMTVGLLAPAHQTTRHVLVLLKSAQSNAHREGGGRFVPPPPSIIE